MVVTLLLVIEMIMVLVEMVVVEVVELSRKKEAECV